MKHLLHLFTGAALICIALNARAVAAPASSEVTAPSPSSLTVQIQNATGTSLATQSDPQKVAVSYGAAYQPGDVIVVNAPPQDKYLVVQLDDKVAESLLYCPTSVVKFPIPFGKLMDGYDPQAFAGATHHLSAHIATPAEISAYRNVALNPLDQRFASLYFPHATASSVTREETQFFERNAIDGNTQNSHHGHWPYESWGNGKNLDPWYKVDFGRDVTVDKIRLFVRADFPHDTYWTNVTFRFSDGTSQAVNLTKTADPQEFTFPAKTVRWVQLTDFKQPTQPLGWAALTEVEVYGKDATKP